MGKAADVIKRTGAALGAGIAGMSGAVAPMSSSHNYALNNPAPAISQRIGDVGKGMQDIMKSVSDAGFKVSQSKMPSNTITSLTKGSSQSKSSGTPSKASATIKGTSASSGTKSSGGTSAGASKGGGQSR